MVYTDFSKYSHAQLRRMAQALDPGAVMAAGDPWRTAATTLKDIRQTLTKASTEAATTWDGTTSDAFHARMLNLAASINNAAAYANDAANILHATSEAMAKAKRDMPEEPGTWDKVKDTVGDFLDSDDDHIQIADRKKAEAATVMQTLAMHYRVATPALKAPPLPSQKSIEKQPDSGPQDDPSNAAAGVAAAVVSGVSFGNGGASARSEAAGVQHRPRSNQTSTATGATSRNSAAPTDSGIKGGVAQSSPKPAVTSGHVPDAGISGTPVSRPSGSVAGPGTAGTQMSGSVVAANGPIGSAGSQTTGASVGPPVQSTPIGPGFLQGRAGFVGKEILGGETPLEGSRSGGSRAVSSGGGEVYPGIGPGGRGTSGTKRVDGSPAKPGGAVHEAMPPGAGARGKEAFTEGGSGLGARNRTSAEPAARGTGMMAPGIPMSEGKRRKKGRRPDYLVEDEESWALDKPANPNVVE